MPRMNAGDGWTWATDEHGRTRTGRMHTKSIRAARLTRGGVFEPSFGGIHERAFILVSLDGDGIEGLGECVADVDPYYGPETTVTAWHVIRDFLAPLVLGRTFDDPRDA